MLSRVKFVCLLVASWLGAAPAAAQTVAARAETAAPRARWSEVRVEFEGNRVFASEKLREVTEGCYGRSRKPEQDFEPELLDYCLRKRLVDFMRQAGRLRATVGEVRTETGRAGATVTVPVEEHELYRLGEIKIDGAEFFAPARLRELLPLKRGEPADGAAVAAWAYERMKELYGDEGFIEFETEIDPDLRPDPASGEGVADFTVTVNEGRRFRLGKLKFKADGYAPEDELREAMRLKRGEVFSARGFREAVARLNELDLFEEVDRDLDAHFQTDEEAGLLDITIDLREKGRERPARRATNGEEARPGNPTLKNRRPQTREE